MSELLESVRRELATLSNEPSKAFWLCCVEAMKYREAAEVMQLDTKHVGMLVHRACKYLIILGSFSIIPWESTSQTAFAEVQHAIRQVRTLIFDMKSYSGNEVTGQYKIRFSQSGDAQMESGLGSHVLRATQAQYMVVDDATRKATTQPVYDLAALQNVAGAFNALLRLEPLPSTKMRSVIVGGKPAREFKTVWDGSVATVVVDTATNLPITIELDRGKGQDGKPVREVVLNFKFDVDLDD